MKNEALEGYRSRVFAVAGGADGIGLALAERAARAGMRCGLLDIRGDAVRVAAENLQARGTQAASYICDVTSQQSLAEAAAQMERDGMSPSILWISARVGIAGEFIEARQSAIDWVFEVNVLGVIRTARTFIPGMLKSGFPVHVGITASSGSVIPADGVYGASKHAVLAIGEALRAELATQGVGVTLLLPGHTNTRIWDAARARPERFGGPRRLPEEVGEN